MKLYTNDQIIAAYNTGYTDAQVNHINDAEQYTASLIPIELPSDEEIEKESDSWEKQSLHNEALLLEAQRQIAVAKLLLRRADMIMASNYSPTVALWHTNYGDFLASLEKAKESENESSGDGKEDDSDERV